LINVSGRGSTLIKGFDSFIASICFLLVVFIIGCRRSGFSVSKGAEKITTQQKKASQLNEEEAPARKAHKIKPKLNRMMFL
jgi:hypothetical protein